ncbi:MAG: type VI secretion system protein TssR, partial [Parabacteroides sp.]|nr:type VI secretion system protein TssR [Parabacteroides sp.]
MKKITLSLLAGLACLCACAPVNRFTRLKKLPREYSENYSIAGIKAPKSEVHRKPWLVYSDRAENAAYVNPGGKVKQAEADWLDAFLVIKAKGDYVQLIKYKPENVKHNRLAERKKAEYVGWMHRSRLILSPSAVTDIRSGLHDKLLTAFTDTSAIFDPAGYLVTADSLKVFADPDLQQQSAVTGLHEIVYALKQGAGGRSVLIARTPDLSADKVREQIVGWVPRVMLTGIGRQVFVNAPRPAWAVPSQTVKYAPAVRPRRTGSAFTFKSGFFAPVIDQTDNQVFNIDGKAISYGESRLIKRNLQRFNVLFSIEQASTLPEQYPMLLNVIQNLRPLFPAADESFTYRFGAAVATGRGIVTLPVTADYEMLVDSLTALVPAVCNGGEGVALPPWSVLNRTLALPGNSPDAVNLIIEIGETGELQEEAPAAIAEALSKKNCRLLGWQLYGSAQEAYNNYNLQLSDMIGRYAAYRTAAKREIILYADQVRHTNLVRDRGNNYFMLDYSAASMSQGGFIFPEKGRTLPMELFARAVDSLVTQIRADNRLLSESIDRAFATVGNTKNRFDSLLVKAYGLPDGIRPDKEFKKMFAGNAPIWFREMPRTTVPDSVVQYRLLLSEPELAQTKERLESLCAMEVDVKDASRPEKIKAKRLCRYLEETELNDEEPVVSVAQPEHRTDTVYVSTRKVRRHLYRFYLSELQNCGVCRVKRRQIRRYPLSYVHEQIFGVPSNNGVLDGITVKGLKKKRGLPDKELDALIRYFKESKERLAEKATEEQI